MFKNTSFPHEDLLMKCVYEKPTDSEKEELERLMVDCPELRGHYQDHSVLKNFLKEIPEPLPHQLTAERFRARVLNEGKSSGKTGFDFLLVGCMVGAAVISFIFGSHQSLERDIPGSRNSVLTQNAVGFSSLEVPDVSLRNSFGTVGYSKSLNQNSQSNFTTAYAPSIFDLDLSKLNFKDSDIHSVTAKSTGEHRKTFHKQGNETFVMRNTSHLALKLKSLRKFGGSTDTGPTNDRMKGINHQRFFTGNGNQVAKRQDDSNSGIVTIESSPNASTGLPGVKSGGSHDVPLGG